MHGTDSIDRQRAGGQPGAGRTSWPPVLGAGLSLDGGVAGFSDAG